MDNNPESRPDGRPAPDDPRPKLSVEVQTAHDAAVSEGLGHYLDPLTGLVSFTELTHLSRGYCCGSGCRHCPYRD